MAKKLLAALQLHANGDDASSILWTLRPFSTTLAGRLDVFLPQVGSPWYHQQTYFEPGLLYPIHFQTITTLAAFLRGKVTESL